VDIGLEVSVVESVVSSVVVAAVVVLVVVAAAVLAVVDGVGCTVLVACGVVRGAEEDVECELPDGQTPEVWPMQASRSESFTGSCGQAPPPKSNE